MRSTTSPGAPDPDRQPPGSFGKAARQHVRVHVEHRLPSTRAGVENQTEVAVGVFGGEFVREPDHLAEEHRIARRELDDVAVFAGLRDHEQVHRRLGCDVADHPNTFSVSAMISDGISPR